MNRTDWEEIRNQTGLQLASLGGIVGGHGIASRRTTPTMTFIPARQSFRSSRVSRGRTGNREMKREGAWEKWRTCALPGCRGHSKSGWVIWDWSPVQNRCMLCPRRRCRPPSRTRGKGEMGVMDRGARESSYENSLRTTSPSSPPPITARLSAVRRNRSHLLY